MSRPRSSSDPSEMKPKAPMAPLAPPVGSLGKRTEILNFGNKSSSGYVGLSNQGATCYLNSLLQCLYMTPEFRHALFLWKYKPPPDTTFDFEFTNDSDQTDTDIDGIYDAPPEHSIPFQLQCLFARLHKSCRGSSSTKPLTKSFHWDDGQSFQQHDVQELLRVLFDAVSRALSRVGKGDLLNNLCKGVLLDYLDCEECHSDRSREDIFLDLSLTIEHLNTLEDAIQTFITPEIMCDGNQVNCHQCNKKQDFKKGLKFKKLPPLLFIQLKRFHYNWEINRRVKLGHKVTFPKELDMTPYIEETYIRDEDRDNLKYALYGVIIQSGGALGGHYYAYIKSYDDDKWYVFNDSSVRELDEKNNEFEGAFGGEHVRGTGYVLLYRQMNLKMPPNYGYFAKYLSTMVEKEDEEIKIQWEHWQKEMRTITVDVVYPKGLHDANTAQKVTLKLDVEEYTFESMLKYVRNEFGINEGIPLGNTRLRKYYPRYEFVAEGYDDDGIQQSKIEIAKWPRNGLNLMFEIKDDIQKKFEYFDPNRILISLFVVTQHNTAALVDRGFVQSATFKPQDLPPGDICSVVVDSKAPLSKIKPVLYDKLRENNLVPDEWFSEDDEKNTFDAQRLNLIKFDYNKIRLFCDNDQSLDEYKLRLGSMVFIEIQSEPPTIDANDDELKTIPKLNPSYQRSKLALLFEEQRLKISVQFNDPLPTKSLHDRVEELLMTAQMLGRKRQTQSLDAEFTNKKRLEFNHALRISKECTLGVLKRNIADVLGLKLNEFRMRKSSNQPELRDMDQTLNAAGLTDGGLVYVEYGVPTAPNESCITFSLYDANKLLTDPHKKKKTLAQKLFEFPFKKDIKVSVLKKEIVAIINQLFPLFRGEYTFNQAIKTLKKEEKEANELEIEQMKKATELSKKETESNTETWIESKTESTESNTNGLIESKTESVTTNANANAALDVESEGLGMDPNPKRRNLFGIEYVRLRKQRGAKVLEMLFDDLKLSTQIMGKKDSLNLVIEKIPIEEHFTKNHICFWLQKYRPDGGKSWNGKIFKKKEFVIDKHSKIIDLKKLIANLLKKTDKRYAELKDDEITKNISMTKGFSTTPMRVSNINRVQWVHRAALFQHGVDPDKYLYQYRDGKDEKIESHNGKIYTEEEVMNVMQTALNTEDDAVIGRPPFHLRNGDLIVWTHVEWRPTKEQIEEKKEMDKEEAKKGTNLRKNPNFKGTKGAKLVSKWRKEPEQLKIRTYEEYLEDEKKKKEEEEKRKELQLKANDTETKDGDGKIGVDRNINLTENAQLFNAMVADNINEIENPKQIERSGSV